MTCFAGFVLLCLVCGFCDFVFGFCLYVKFVGLLDWFWSLAFWCMMRFAFLLVLTMCFGFDFGVGMLDVVVVMV